MSEKSSLDRLANFFFEAGMLQKMERSGNKFLGSGNASVADHSFRTAIIGFTMARRAGADAFKVMAMCMFHDLEEARTGDLNYLEQRYCQSDDKRALSDALKNLPIENEVHSLIEEYSALETMEAKIAKDADTLELIFFLKEEKDKGNQQADNWLRGTLLRLLTDEAKKLAEAAMEVMYYEWWYNLDEEWKSGSKDW